MGIPRKKYPKKFSPILISTAMVVYLSLCVFAYADSNKTEWVRSGNIVSTSFIKTNLTTQGTSALTGTQISYSFVASFARPLAEKENGYDVIRVPGLELWEYPGAAV